MVDVFRIGIYSLNGAVRQRDAVANVVISGRLSAVIDMSSPNKTIIRESALGADPMGAGPNNSSMPAVPIVLATQPSTPDPINVLESLYDAIVITNLLGRIQQCNHRAEELTGYARQDLSGLTVGQLVMGITDELLITIERQLSVGRFTVLEGRCTRKDGSTFPGEIAVSSVQLSEGRGFCFSLRNISQRREMQNRLRLAQNAMQSSASALVMADLDSKIKYANTAFCKMWNVGKLEDVIGKGMAELFGIENTSKLRTCLENKEPWIGELTCQRADASELNVQATAALNIDHQNVLVGMVLSFIDITQQKRAEDKIRREVEAQLQQARKQKDFAGQLNIIALPELIQFIDASGKTGRLEILRSSDGASARLGFESGRIVSANCGEVRGEAAVFATLNFGGNSFSFHQDAEIEKDDSITKTTMGLLLDGLRHIDEAASAAAAPPA